MKRSTLKRGASPLKRKTRMPRIGRRGREDRKALAAVRAEVMARARNLCERCKRHRRICGPLDPHHRLMRSQGGAHTASNLAALCRRCHDAITDRRAPDWRAWIVTRRGAA